MVFPTGTYKYTRLQRLLAADDFSRVIKNAERKGSAKYMTILAIENKLPYARLGIIVGKKKVRRANKRNKIKRTVRESFRQQQHDLVGLDIVFIAKKGTGNLAKLEIRECLDKLWKRLTNQRSA